MSLTVKSFEPFTAIKLPTLVGLDIVRAERNSYTIGLCFGLELDYFPIAVDLTLR